MHQLDYDPFSLDDFDAPPIVPTQAPTSPAETNLLLQGLTPAQTDAVLHIGSPLQINAGAGTGKTRVLTTRVAYQIEMGFTSPENVLALTFTNKAASELKKRIRSLTQQHAHQISAGTFHSLCANLLRAHPIETGLKPGFSIIDADDQKQLLRSLYKKQTATPLPADKAKAASKCIDEWKSTLTDLAMHFAPEIDDIRDLIFAYEKTLKEQNSVDFSDLIQKAVQLLENNTQIRDHYQALWTHIYVDEYQDTNIAQARLLKLLAADKPDITIVGDDDQSVYSFRFAEVANILNFSHQYENTTQIKLERNFRSTGSIIDCANYLIANNTRRLQKQLYTETEPGPVVETAQYDSDYQEAEAIATKVQNLISTGTATQDIAVIARSSHILRLSEHLLLTKGIPYQLSGGKKFNEHSEIRDLAAYIRLIRNPFDLIAFNRAIVSPKRQIGPSVLKRIEDTFSLTQHPPLVILEDMLAAAQLTKTAAKNAALFIEFFRSTNSAHTDDQTALPLLEAILSDTGYLDALSKERHKASAQTDEDKVARILRQLDRIELLKQAAACLPLKQFADFLGLSATDTSQNDGVWLGTIHSAKGAEWPHVFLPGWEYTTFPTHYAIDKNCAKAMEEERRLAFVAVTRAKTNLTITSANQRFGKPLAPSPFLTELTSAT